MAFAAGHVDEIIALAESQMFDLENPGLCVYCGAEAYGIEPDAEKYRCDECGKRGVYGAQELLLYL